MDNPRCRIPRQASPRQTRQESTRSAGGAAPEVWAPGDLACLGGDAHGDATAATGTTSRMVGVRVEMHTQQLGRHRGWGSCARADGDGTRGGWERGHQRHPRARVHLDAGRGRVCTLGGKGMKWWRGLRRHWWRTV
jgi:hypothetical protein